MALAVPLAAHQAAGAPLRNAGGKNPDARAGAELAHQLCANCHAVDRSGPMNRADRVPSFAWIANQPGATETSVTVWLSTKHQRMPNVMLTDEEIRQLSDYIMVLKK